MSAVLVYVLLALSVKTSHQQTDEAECTGECLAYIDEEGAFCAIQCDQEYSEEFCYCEHKEDLNTECRGSQYCTDDTPSLDYDQAKCRKLCNSVNTPENPDSCVAYTYTLDTTIPNASIARCTIWQECKKDVLSQSPGQVSGQPCTPEVSCHTLEAKDGPTAIHWTCQRDGTLPSFVNPYYVNVTEGTACSPTSMCSDPKVSINDRLECRKNGANAGGQWFLKKEGGADNGVSWTNDEICNCPTLKIKQEAGMGLECESPLDPTSPFELKEPNTCVLLCEGLEKATLTCQLNDQVPTGTNWVSSYENEHVVVTAGCISCHEGLLDAECQDPALLKPTG